MFKLIRAYLEFTSPSITNRAGTLVDVSEASKNFLNLVRPQVTSSRADAGDNQNTQALIQRILSGADDDHQALIDSILQRSAIDFAPTRAAEVNSGGYNSTVGVQLQNEARARATGEATGAVLQAKTEAERTAANLQAAKLNANRTQTVAPPTSIGELLKSVGASVAINSLYKKGLAAATGFGAKTPKASAGSPGDSDIFGYDSGYGGGSTVDGGSTIAASGGVDAAGSSLVQGTSYGDFAGVDSSGLDTLLGVTGDAAAGNSAGLTALTDSTVANSGVDAAGAGAYGDFGSTLGGATIDPNSGATVAAGGTGVNEAGTATALAAEGSNYATYGELGDAGTEANVLSEASSASALGEGAAATEAGGTAVASEGALAGLGDAAASFGSTVIPAYVGATVATQVGGDLLSTAFGGEDAGMVGDLGDFFGDIGKGIKGNTVICTELYRQGLMFASTRRYNAVWASRNLNPVGFAAYQVWGSAYVQLMRRSPRATKLAEVIFTSWSRWIRGDRSRAAWIGACFIPVVWLPSVAMGYCMILKQKLSKEQTCQI